LTRFSLFSSRLSAPRVITLSTNQRAARSVNRAGRQSQPLPRLCV